MLHAVFGGGGMRSVGSRPGAVDGVRVETRDGAEVELAVAQAAACGIEAADRGEGSHTYGGSGLRVALESLQLIKAGRAQCPKEGERVGV